jgi:hypothetical protein
MRKQMLVSFHIGISEFICIHELEIESIDDQAVAYEQVLWGVEFRVFSNLRLVARLLHLTPEEEVALGKAGVRVLLLEHLNRVVTHVVVDDEPSRLVHTLECLVELGFKA